jgi:hypothetical protein
MPACLGMASGSCSQQSQAGAAQQAVCRVQAGSYSLAAFISVPAALAAFKGRAHIDFKQIRDAKLWRNTLDLQEVAQVRGRQSGQLQPWPARLAGGALGSEPSLEPT